MPALPSLDDVRRAAMRLDGVVNRTPVLTSRHLDARTGGFPVLKAECFQRTGSFKFRGAYNAVASMSDEARARGVAAYSSGNHAQAVALAAALHDVPSVILMPEDAPASKVEATRGYGAEIVTYDRYSEERTSLGEALASERGMSLVPPFDHDDVIAGQGTVALELFEDTGPLDLLVVCVGGGGLISGCATVAAGSSPRRAMTSGDRCAPVRSSAFPRRGRSPTGSRPPPPANGPSPSCASGSTTSYSPRTTRSGRR